MQSKLRAVETDLVYRFRRYLYPAWPTKGQIIQIHVGFVAALITLRAGLAEQAAGQRRAHAQQTTSGVNRSDGESFD